MEYLEIRKKVIHYALELQRRGLIHGTSGNISLRSDDGKVIAITPTSIPYETLTPGDITLVDEHANILDGDKKPTSEVLMHTSILRARKDLNSVVHTHSMFATVFSVINREIPAVTVPQMRVAPVKVVPFRIPGSQELADAVVETLGKDGKAVTLMNHGLLVADVSLEKAFSLAEYVEEAAQVGYYALIAGAMNPITDDSIRIMKEIFYSGRAL